MEKYVTNIKDLVIQTIKNGSEIRNKANSGDPIGCFQMGIINLLGINTPVDFKKASQFFSNQSLSDNQDAIRLLGFIAECEGHFSQAFQNYAQTESSEKDSYLDKVIKGRNHIQDYLKKLDLPVSLNKEVSSILSDYPKDKSSKTGASVKIAAICNDEQSCLEAANNLYDANDYISAIQWLKKGNIGLDNSMYAVINEMLEKSKSDLLKSKVLQIINLKSSSLLTKEDPTPFLNKLKQSCDEESMKCLTEWKEKNQSYIGNIIKEYKDQEQKAYLASLSEEAEAKKKKQRMYIIIGVAICILLGVLVSIIPSSSEKEPNNVGTSNIEKSIEKETIKKSDNESSIDQISSIEEDEIAPSNTHSSVNMRLSGKIGGEAVFVMEGNSGWYQMTYEGADKVKRSLELESYSPEDNNCSINAYLRDKYIGKFVGVLSLNNESKVEKYEGVFESVKGAKVDFTLYSE